MRGILGLLLTGVSLVGCAPASKPVPMSKPLEVSFEMAEKMDSENPLLFSSKIEGNLCTFTGILRGIEEDERSGKILLTCSEKPTVTRIVFEFEFDKKFKPDILGCKLGQTVTLTGIGQKGGGDIQHYSFEGTSVTHPPKLK